MNGIFENIPLPGKTGEEYDCGEYFILGFENCSEKDFAALCDEFICKGYSLYSSHDIENNLHRVFTAENVTVNTYFTPSESKIRVIAEEGKPEFAVSPVYSGEYTPTLWQFEVDHSLIDCGMCYIVRCDDGSFFIIDSPHFYSVNDDIRITDFLRKISGEEKPRVSGWFFSHGHEDHIGIFNSILKYHGNELSIEALYFNFPPLTHRDAPLWDKSFYNLMKSFYEITGERPDIKKIRLHTGNHFFIKNLEFEVLCTHEDVYPGSLADFNNSSTALKMTVNGSKTLFPGDCSALSDKVLTGRYKEALKCEIIQVSHHGHSGLSPEFYRRVDAKCALFPVTVIKFDEEWPRQEANRVAAEIAKEYYIASDGTVEIPLPYEYGKTKIYPDETFEDFEGIYNLWQYEYTEERKQQLYEEYKRRSKR
ncbi:MAG: hypothetical protein IJJ61_09095 [Clostridia bacterium]|nr:hypothetical protein [Clostridia bacterium]